MQNGGAGASSGDPYHGGGASDTEHGSMCIYIYICIYIQLSSTYPTHQPNAAAILFAVQACPVYQLSMTPLRLWEHPRRTRRDPDVRNSWGSQQSGTFEKWQRATGNPCKPPRVWNERIHNHWIQVFWTISHVPMIILHHFCQSLSPHPIPPSHGKVSVGSGLPIGGVTDDRGVGRTIGLGPAPTAAPTGRGGKLRSGQIQKNMSHVRDL